MGASSRSHRYLQFSLGTAFALLTLVGLTLGILFAMPQEEPVLLMLPILMFAPMVFTICAVYGRGYLRTFAIGAGFPALLFFFSPYLPQIVFWRLDELLEANPNAVTKRLIILAYLAVACLVFLIHGGIAMLIRWVVERWQRPEAETKPETPHVESPFDAGTARE